MPELNPREARIAEETVSVIDFMSRMLGAIEDGNWHYAADKLGQLDRALENLRKQIARKDYQAAGPVVAAYVARDSQHYRIGRALYGRPAEDAKRRRDLFGEIDALMHGQAEGQAARD
ncbi:hypothetical protein AB0C10_21545 [Microbispora amethystogenes]|uniref:hypothetical protein n=1 Tax=Microbispora amethystogenes TaxID=1427754 RepID=UPI00340A8368